MLMVVGVLTTGTPGEEIVTLNVKALLFHVVTLPTPGVSFCTSMVNCRADSPGLRVPGLLIQPVLVGSILQYCQSPKNKSMPAVK